MKFLFWILTFFYAICSSGQNSIDLVNVYWRSSPFNKTENSALQNHLNTVSADAKLPVVLNDSNIFILGVEHQRNSITESESFSIENGLNYHSSMLQLGWEHKWNENSKMLIMGMTRLNSYDTKIKLNKLQQAWLVLGTTKKSERFQWKYGAYYNSEFFGPMIVPLFGFKWTPTPKWILNLVAPVNIELAYKPKEKFRIGLKYEGLNASYSIKSTDPLNDIYLDKADNNIWFFTEVECAKNIWAHLKMGHSILREYTIYRADEKMDLKISAASVADDRTETAPILEDGISLELRLIYRLPL